MEDKKQKTLLAAGLNFSDDAANTVFLISIQPPVSVEKDPRAAIITNSGQTKLNGSEVVHEYCNFSRKMGVPEENPEPVQTNGEHTNGIQAAVREEIGKNGHATPAEELNDFSRQINIDSTKPNGNVNNGDGIATQTSPVSLASPDASSSLIPDPPPLPALEYPTASQAESSSSFSLKTSPGTPSPKFVGLVNQAMTCYLNSLLQALYMTPEFRNALYNWEFDGHDESKSIPCQLQRLFLNLQTSPRSAVETTDLTRSFGWDSSEAWQQHDIQELCRVMFDALEHKFKATKEADLINRLYEGKMIDYLKCLGCGTERQREDTFLDIPLPVKPFGSSVAFGSIEEALRAFIQPEILNGNNQYSCGKCDKKCDAHKGLKFSKFPYILTLHLKRFDFDYQTFHRIKLNDKVTFPQTLNLNGFINTSTDFEPPNHDSVVNGASATGAGNGTESANHNGNTPMDVDADEGEEDKEKAAADKGNADEQRSKRTFGSHSGPYLYELFAIMIHSGSASGGHYYVYIKDLETTNWFCFNDQCVSPITQEDIQKSFGGSAGRFHYSGAYTTSTNAYMLMYRQMDPKRNKLPTPVEALPEHIQRLQKKLTDRQELDNRRRTTTTATSTTDYSVITTRVYHYDRRRCTLSDVKIHISGDYYLDELLQRSYDRMSLATLRSLNLCRLVAFDSKSEQTLASIEQHDSTLLQDVLDKYTRCDFLLEERDREETFRTYSTPMLNARVYVVDMEAGNVDGPNRVPIPLTGTVADMKQEIRDGVLKNLCAGELRVALLKANFAVVLNNDKDVLKHEIDPSELCPVKLFVAGFPECAKTRTTLFDKRLKKIAEKFDRVVSLFFKVPVITTESRIRHSIPDYVSPFANVVAEKAQIVAPVAVPVSAEEETQPGRPVSMDICSDSSHCEGFSCAGGQNSNNYKALSPTPEPASSNAESTRSPSPSPEPPEAKSRESSTSAEVKVVKKKSLTSKSVTGEDKKSVDEKAKEKSTVKTTRETVETKEVTVNGVTKKVRVVKRIIKKDPNKKTTINGIDPVPSSEGSAEKSTTPKVVKKVKVASKAPAKVANTEPVPVKLVSVEMTPPKPDEKQTSPVPEVTMKLPDPVPEVTLTLPVPVVTVDAFSFLDVATTTESDSVGMQYFRAIPINSSICEPNGSIADDEMQLLQVHVDKGMTVSALKSWLEPVLQVSKDYFKVNRSRTETLRLHESVSNMQDGEELIIELGRILQDGEYKYKVSHLKLSTITDYTEELPHLCDYIVRNGQRVEEVKSGILDYLVQNGNEALGRMPAKKFRLWTKLYQSLGQVCIEDSVLGEDITLRKSGEFVLEEIESEVQEEPLLEFEDFVIFTRKWNPDTLALDHYEAVTLRGKFEL